MSAEEERSMASQWGRVKREIPFGKEHLVKEHCPNMTAYNTQIITHSIWIMYDTNTWVIFVFAQASLPAITIPGPGSVVLLSYSNAAGKSAQEQNDT